MNFENFNEQLENQIKLNRELKQKLYKSEKHSIINKRAITEIKEEMDSLSNPNKMYERLGVDILAVSVSDKLVPLAGPILLSGLQVLRKNMVDTYGYIIPNIRIMDNCDLKDNEYSISVRSFEVYKSNLEESLSDYEKIEKIVQNLQNICFEYTHQIFTHLDIYKIIELVKLQKDMSPLIDDIISEFISTIELKYIFCELIHKKISIKDIVYVFELLTFYARKTQNLDELVEILSRELVINVSKL